MNAQVLIKLYLLNFTSFYKDLSVNMDEQNQPQNFKFPKTISETLDNKLKEVDVSEPALPRRRKMPKRFESGSEYPETPKDLYRQKYFEALDLVINCIQDRFDQPGFQTYRRLQDALRNGIRKDGTADEDISYVTATYRDDINGLAFRTQLDTLGTLLQSSRKDLNEVSLSDIVQMIRDMKPGSRTLFSEIVTVLKLFYDCDLIVACRV